jgi:hypothetical protein
VPQEEHVRNLAKEFLAALSNSGGDEELSKSFDDDQEAIWEMKEDGHALIAYSILCLADAVNNAAEKLDLQLDMISASVIDAANIRMGINTGVVAKVKEDRHAERMKEAGIDIAEPNTKGD